MSYARQTGDKPSISDTYCLYMSKKKSKQKEDLKKKRKKMKILIQID